MAWRPEDLTGKLVRTGCGSCLGRVVAVNVRPHGTVEDLRVRQLDGSKTWIVEAVHVKRVTDEVVLEGPRDGYHIAPLAPRPIHEVAPRAPAADAPVMGSH